MPVLLCRKRSKSKQQNKGGKDSVKKSEKTEPKQQAQQDYDDIAEEYDEGEEDMQFVDFDKLIDTLKYEKKMVEICIPQSSPATNKSKVCTVFT
jgi:hypothetical protein